MTCANGPMGIGWLHACKGAGCNLLVPMGELCDRCGESAEDAPPTSAVGDATVVSKGLCTSPDCNCPLGVCLHARTASTSTVGGASGLTQREVDAIYALRHAADWIGSAPHGDNCFVSAHYEGDPGDRCNCGKDSAEQAMHDALGGYPETMDGDGEPLELVAASVGTAAEEVRRLEAENAILRASLEESVGTAGTRGDAIAWRWRWRHLGPDAPWRVTDYDPEQPRPLADLLEVQPLYSNSTLAAAAPKPEPCPRGEQRPEPWCTNRLQCWEPCGELGKSAEHVRVARSEGPTNDEIFSLWLNRTELHDGDLKPQLCDFARAVLSAFGTDLPDGAKK